jgi:metal-sulfur cluster biosynthetic enzyme
MAGPNPLPTPPPAPPPRGEGSAEGKGRRGERYAEYPHDALWNALREVEDPEMGISIVDMGLIVAARLDGEVAHVTLTYTAMGCPAVEMIEEDVRKRLRQTPGVRAVEIETVWQPVWTKARLTAEGRDGLLLAGLAL